MSQGQVQNTTLARVEDIPKTYNQLLARHPLRPIQTDVELAHATEILDMLAGHELNRDQEDYLDVLSTLVEAYEHAHHPLDDPALSGLDVLRALVAEHGMTAADLARLLGVHRSLGSKLLKGERALTTQHLKILSARFKVSADVFLEHAKHAGV